VESPPTSAQTALILILAQLGSFVPAEAALLSGRGSRSLLRIGAADNLARGTVDLHGGDDGRRQQILNTTATSRSFIVLDEIGRGTSYLRRFWLWLGP